MRFTFSNSSMCLDSNALSASAFFNWAILAYSSWRSYLFWSACLFYISSNYCLFSSYLLCSLIFSSSLWITISFSDIHLFLSSSSNVNCYMCSFALSACLPYITYFSSSLFISTLIYKSFEFTVTWSCSIYSINFTFSSFRPICSSLKASILYFLALIYRLSC